MNDGLALKDRPDSLAEVVYQAIRKAIMDKTLAPGARITETGIAAQLNVSKTPVREAFLKLRQIGLIEEGGRVVRPSLDAITHAYGAREALEVFAARTVAEIASEAEIEVMREAAERSLSGARSTDHAEFRSWDFAFHRAIGNALGNPIVSGLTENLFTLIVTLRERDAPRAADYPIECAEAHVRIVEAIAARAPEHAESSMRAHVRQVRDHVLAGFSQGFEGERRFPEAADRPHV